MSYTATITTTAPPERIIAMLTEPDSIRAWSPVPFETDGGGESLRAGSETRVSGNLAGLRVGFDVQVHAADHTGLRLSADGPVTLDVDYGVQAAGAGSELQARISLRRARGLGGRVVGKATEALLAGGALERATTRIARAAEDAATGAVSA